MNVVILSRPIRSGKTTSLQAWFAGRPGARGILMPDIDGRRYFSEIGSTERWPIDAWPEHGTQAVGPFLFSDRALEKALAVLTKQEEAPEWLVVDEIGKWELAGGGFFPLFGFLEKAPGQRPENLLLVVRDSLLEAVVERFGLQDARVVHSPGDI